MFTTIINDVLIEFSEYFSECKNLSEIINNFLEFFRLLPHFLWILYVIVEHGFKKSNFLQKPVLTPPKNFLIWLITLILFILFTTCLIPLFFLKIFVVIFLRIRHQNNFGGCFRSADNLWVVEDKEALNIINLLFIIKLKNTTKNLKTFVKDLIEKRIFKTKKMTSVRQFFFGYGYFLLNQVKTEDVTTFLTFSDDGFLNENDLKKFVMKFSNRNLPKNGAFEVIVCEDRVFLNQNDQKNENYAILLRVHHSVADGMTLMSFLNQEIADKRLDNDGSEKNKETEKINQFSLKKNFNSKAYLHTLIAKRDQNDLKKSKLSGRKRIAFKIEEKSEDLLLKKVKIIKNLIPNCTFTAVLLTAISISLYDFFRKTQKTIPEKLILTFMSIADKNQLHFNHNKLRNIFSMGSIHLPIDFKNFKNVKHQNEKGNQDDLLERLKEVIEECRRSEESCDIWIHYWQLKSFSNLLPKPIVKFILNLNDVTSVSFSNLPGIKKIEIDGNELSHMMFWVPNYVTIGAGFSLSTYDDRFQMGFLVDECLISNDEDVQEVLNGVFENLEQLYEVAKKFKCESN